MKMPAAPADPCTARAARTLLPRRPAEPVADAGFLVLVVGLSVASYVHRIGFYSDDWAFLSNLTHAADRSLIGLTRAVTGPHMHMRPVQGLYLSWLYQLFGADPLGYHLVNAGVLAGTAVLLHLVMRELRQPRLLAVAVPAVYVLLPHYSTDRFWYAAFQATLSMALYALCLYADLRAVSAPGRRWWSWKAVSAVALIGSALAYEVAIPLFLLNPVLAWYRGRQLHGGAHRTRPLRARAWVAAASTLAVLIPALAFKAATTTRFGHGSGSFPGFVLWLGRRALRWDFGQTDYGFNIWRAAAVHFVELGVGLPVVVWRILRAGPDTAVLLLALAVTLLTYLYLTLIARRSPAPLPERATALRSVAAGAAVFGLGFAIFLTNPNIYLTPTGISNRTAIAAALGVAIVFVGAAVLVTTLVRRPAVRLHAFAALVALLCGAGTLVNGALASFWIAAWEAEQRVIGAIRSDVPSLPRGARVILDGVCPFIGPAPVFESSWDFAAALQIAYRDPAITGDVVTPRMSVDDDGLRTTLYAVEHHHPWDDLLIYDARHGAAHRIGNVHQARAYFDAFNPDMSSGCPVSHEGIGVPVFRAAPAGRDAMSIAP